MAKIWLCLCFLVLVLGLTIAQNENVNENIDEDDYDDAWFKDYDDQWDKDELEKFGAEDGDLKSKEATAEEKPTFDKDYQIEDNRYLTEEEDDEENDGDYNLEDIPDISKEVPLEKYEQEIIKQTLNLLRKTDSKMEISNESTNTEEKDNKIDNVAKNDNKDLSKKVVTKPIEEKDTEADDSETIEDNSLNKDLLDLIESIRKLRENYNENLLNSEDTNEVLDYEDKNNRPFHEGVILQQRQNNDDDIDDEVSIESKTIDEVSDVNNELENDNKKDKIDEVEKVIAYGEDGLDASKEETSSKVLDESKAPKLDLNIDPETIKNNDVAPTKTPIDVASIKERLTNTVAEKRTGDDVANVDAPIKIPINYNENIPIMSPKYPDSYPNIDMIYDYILEGDGLGVELNITEVNINGAADDFLLIIPGGIDETSTGGLIFSHNLDQERLYRFTEVDRLFVRFRTHDTPQPPSELRWTISVRLLGPRPLPPKPAPEPEPEAPAARYTHTVYFGGVTPMDFKDISEEFHRILTQMVSLYVRENEINPGNMALNEIVNITRVSVCNINWPDFDNCAAVTFAAPLLYDEELEAAEGHRLNAEDLAYMWNTYSVEPPFADKMSNLGLTVFSIPNDGWALTLWLSIGTACLILAAGLAYAVWRWSCFEDYSKMPEFSDTDSNFSQKKQDLSLYPTPYQDLPALYADPYDGDHKYPRDMGTDDVTRVDMDGFSNKGFTHDPHFFSLDYNGDDVKKSRRSDLSSSGALPPFYPNGN